MCVIFCALSYVQYPDTHRPLHVVSGSSMESVMPQPVFSLYRIVRWLNEERRNYQDCPKITQASPNHRTWSIVQIPWYPDWLHPHGRRTECSKGPYYEKFPLLCHHYKFGSSETDTSHRLVSWDRTLCSEPPSKETGLCLPRLLCLWCRINVRGWSQPLYCWVPTGQR